MKLATLFQFLLTFPVRVQLCGSSCFFSPVMLFIWHLDGERYDVLCLLHRGHVNHAAAEGERTLNRFTTERERLDQTYTVNVL